MKKLVLLSCLVFVALVNNAQINFDSLNRVVDTTVLVRKKIDKFYFGSTGKTLSKTDFAKFKKRLLELGSNTTDKKNEAWSYYRVAWLYYYQSKYNECLPEFFKCLKIAESLNDSSLIALTHAEIGDAYLQIKNKDYAKKHLYYSLNFLNPKKKKDNPVYDNTYMSLSTLYKDQSIFDSALKYANLKLNLALKLDQKSKIAASYNTIGLVYKKQKNYDKALLCFQKSLELRRELKDVGSTAGLLINMGNTYNSKKEHKKAIPYFVDGIVVAAKVNNLHYCKNGLGGLAESYNGVGDYKNSAKTFKRYVALKDSLLDLDMTKQMSELTAQYETSKKDAEIALQEEQLKSSATENSKQKILIVASVVALLASLMAIFFVYRSFRLSKKNAIQLAFKNEVIEEKNKEITDSINYAKLIQQSLLASKEMLDKNLENYFILYKPKDIVSGDFYWASESSKGFLIAAVDCTGHGVPGAFMSLIGKENLDKAATKYHQPGQILSELNRGVKKSLNQKSNANKDGMDAALVCVTKNENKRTVFYSGANRPLYIVRKENSVFEEVKATKYAIGGFTEDTQVFEEHSIELQKGDMIYISTDGFADQFGSDKNKKLTTKRFKEILVSLHTLDPLKQNEELEKVFTEWKGSNEQLDDLLVIGIRL